MPKTAARRRYKLITDEMVASFYLIGSEEQCRQRIAEYRAAGVDLPLILPRLEDYARVAEAMRGA